VPQHDNIEIDGQHEVSFVAICDGRPDDQLSADPQRLHTFAIIQDETPDSLLAFTARVVAAMGRINCLSNWAGSPPGYRARFANAFRAELIREARRVHIYEATEAEIVASEAVTRQLIPSSVNYQVHMENGSRSHITASGIATNLRTGVRIEPRASWDVGVVVGWMAMAITDFYAGSANAFQEIHGQLEQLPFMILATDRLPRESVSNPNATALLRAILHGTIRDHIGQQHAGRRGGDNEAEKLIDNIVGMFNDRHIDRASAASQVTIAMMSEPAHAPHLFIQRLNHEYLSGFLANRGGADP
jgi:hypothetical protein